MDTKHGIQVSEICDKLSLEQIVDLTIQAVFNRIAVQPYDTRNLTRFQGITELLLLKRECELPGLNPYSTKNRPSDVIKYHIDYLIQKYNLSGFVIALADSYPDYREDLMILAGKLSAQEREAYECV